MSSNMISNHQQSDIRSETDSESHRKKRRKIEDSASASTSTGVQFRWRTTVEQQTYSKNLIAALRRVRNRNDQLPTISGSIAVRNAADKALATTAKGRTRWSRAILNNRLKLRLKKYKKAKTRSKFSPPPLPPISPSLTASDTTAPVDKRVKVLSRLVPGCRKLSFPNLLEETTDYIAALQMQVRAMTALAQLLSGSTSSSGSFPSTGLSSSAGSIDIQISSRSSNDRDNPVIS